MGSQPIRQPPSYPSSLQSSKQINLQHRQIKDKDLINLSLSMSNLQGYHLEKIHLEWNFISYKSLGRFREISLKNVDYLNLYSNRIGSKGVKILTSMQLQNLKILSIGKNRINRQGSYHLSKAKWPLLQSLDLSNNRVDEQFLRYLMLANFNSLKNLNLNGNELDEGEAKVILKAKWQQLESIRINKVVDGVDRTPISMKPSSLFELRMIKKYHHNVMIQI